MAAPARISSCGRATHTTVDSHKLFAQSYSIPTTVTKASVSDVCRNDQISLAEATEKSPHRATANSQVSGLIVVDSSTSHASPVITPVSASNSNIAPNKVANTSVPDRSCYEEDACIYTTSISMSAYNSQFKGADPWTGFSTSTLNPIEEPPISGPSTKFPHDTQYYRNLAPQVRYDVEDQVLVESPEKPQTIHHAWIHRMREGAPKKLHFPGMEHPIKVKCGHILLKGDEPIHPDHRTTRPVSVSDDIDDHIRSITSTSSTGLGRKSRCPQSIPIVGPTDIVTWPPLLPLPANASDTGTQAATPLPTICDNTCPPIPPIPCHSTTRRVNVGITLPQGRVPCHVNHYFRAIPAISACSSTPVTSYWSPSDGKHITSASIRIFEASAMYYGTSFPSTAATNPAMRIFDKSAAQNSW